ncbi:MAG TPA: hydroxymethylbilane synthase [Blastocatellia bacterium]|nr:hydroxymethylbilane synthase [Blastocatellia bacterium]
MDRKLIIGSRGSKLALWQTEWVKSKLERLTPGLEIEIKVLSTKGDRVLDVSLPKLGEQGKGLFTAELEEALFGGAIDLAVHSLKDLPTELPAGLQIGSITEREDVRDALVIGGDARAFNQLTQGALIGTSSLRRHAQVRAARPDLMIEPVRGNVDTRLRKLDEGNFDAIILAAAGLRRLGYAHRITEYLSEEFMLSAVGQGALAIETRADDQAVNEIVRRINHGPTESACKAERAFLKGLGGGCLVPIAALGKIEGDEVSLDGLVAAPDGSEIVRGIEKGLAIEPEAVGRRLADELLRRGAGRLLSRE